MIDFSPTAWAAFLLNCRQRQEAIAAQRLAEAIATDARLEVLCEEVEDGDRWGAGQVIHTLCRNAHGDLFYERAYSGPVIGSRSRHEVWTASEIADVLESDDGPFNLWDHEWQSIHCGLLVVHAMDQDWYVLPEGK
jgi:hypothetical protein